MPGRTMKRRCGRGHLLSPRKGRLLDKMGLRVAVDQGVVVAKARASLNGRLIPRRYATSKA